MARPLSFGAPALIAGAALVGMLVGGACAMLPGDTDDWWDQLEARSPCYEVDLLDGLDESSTAEVADLFWCLNHHGHLDPLVPTVDVLERPSRESVPAGVEVARLANHLPDAGVDVWALAGVVVDALRSPDRPVDELTGLWLELTYGVPASRVRSGQVPLSSAASLEQGLLAPLAPVLPLAAEAALDDDLRVSRWAGDVLADSETNRWIRSLDAWSRSSRASIKEPYKRLLPDLGVAIVTTRSPGNDHWSGASGDSLRDMADALTSGNRPLIARVAPELSSMLGDRLVVSTVEDDLVELADAGHLVHALPQARWMATVDVDGGTLGSSEDSGLYALVRLLHDANQPMECTLDLWITDLDVDLGNLSVSLLDLIADQDPDTVQTGVGILGEVIGWGLSEWLLYEIAESGICPTLTVQVVDDLAAIDLFYEPETYDLLVVLIDVLSALKYGEENHIPDLVDTAATLYDHGAVHPFEELLRDIGERRVIEDVVDLVPVLVDPGAHGLTAGDEPAVDLVDVIDVVAWLVEREDGTTGWGRLEPVVQPVVAADGTWEAVGNAGYLLSDPDSHASRLLVEALPALVDLDPELVVLDQVAPLLGDDQVSGPLLRVVETVGLSEALLATSPQGADPEVPLGFASRLIVNGALDDLLAMVDVMLGALDEVRE